MIFINFVYGQLCNQLFLFSHLLAHGEVTGRRVWFPGFRKNEGQFEYFLTDRKTWSKNVYLPFSGDRAKARAEAGLRRVLHKDGKLLRLVEAVTRRKLHVSLDYLNEFMYPENEGGRQLTTPLCLFEGWVFRVPSALAAFAPQLRQIFRFRPAEVDRARTFLSAFPYKNIIGVHIRQSDYAQDAPQFCWTPGQYLTWMQALRGELGPDTGFVVVTDGKIPDFNESWITLHRGNAVQDLCVLSHCHRIMGPPSTFNRWAAFVGDKPHLALWTPDQEVTSRDFAPFKILSRPKNLSPNEVHVMNFFGIV